MNSFYAMKTKLHSVGGTTRNDRDSSSVEQPEQPIVEKRRIDPAQGKTSQLVAHDLVKSYRKGRHLVPVLLGVDLEVRHHEFVAIVGQSGSGKSTLLHLLGTLDAPDGGEIHFEGNRIDNLPALQ